MDALAANILGYTVYGMPLPSSGTLGLSLVGYVLSLALLYLCQSSISSVKSSNIPAVLMNRPLALKDWYPAKLGLINKLTSWYWCCMLLWLGYRWIWTGMTTYYKAFTGINVTVSWFSRSQAIISRWSRLRDHGTSYSCVVEAEGNAVSTTTTINYGFGAGVLFPSTGIVLNNTHRDNPWHTPSCSSKFYLTLQESFIFFHDTFYCRQGLAGGAVVQLLVQTLQNPIDMDRENARDSVNTLTFHGRPVAVSDPRKDDRLQPFDLSDFLTEKSLERKTHW